MQELAEVKRDALPGHPLIWMLIVSEVLVFAIFLVAFLVQRLLHADEFRSSAHFLHAGSGTLSMAVLLASGFAAALGLAEARLGSAVRARARLLLAASLGAVFLLLKAHEYADLWQKEISFEASSFFTLYALITGFHAAHVAFGAGLLTLVAWRPVVGYVEPSVAFWHMVDLVWVLVFPVVYLVPR